MQFKSMAIIGVLAVALFATSVFAHPSASADAKVGQTTRASIQIPAAVWDVALPSGKYEFLGDPGHPEGTTYFGTVDESGGLTMRVKGDPNGIAGYFPPQGWSGVTQPLRK